MGDVERQPNIQTSTSRLASDNHEEFPDAVDKEHCLTKRRVVRETTHWPYLPSNEVFSLRPRRRGHEKAHHFIVSSAYDPDTRIDDGCRRSPFPVVCLRIVALAQDHPEHLVGLTLLLR